MEQNGKITKEESFSQICRKIYAGIISVAVLVVFLVFPLYYRNYYFDMLESKYQFYYMTMLAMFLIVVLVSIAFLVVDALEFKLCHVKTLLKNCIPKKPRNIRDAAEWCLIIFLIACIISTLQSDYQFEAFWGNEGRYSGLFLHLIYIAGFFVVSRLYRFKKWHICLFLGISVLPLLFGITDYFCMDIMHFKVNVAEKDLHTFMSTFGNINTYVTYVGIIFGMFSLLFATEKKTGKTCLYYAGYLLAVLSMIMANSDNAVLAIGFIFMFLPLFIFQQRRGVERYLWLLTGFFASCRVVGWINTIMPEKVIPLEGVFRLFATTHLFFAAAIFFALLAAALHFLRMKDNEGKKEELGKRYVMIWAALLLICFCAGVFILYDANGGGHSERYGSLGAYLHFSDEWGTYRGMVWRIALEAYAKQPFGHKLWGYGLETFGLMTIDYRGETSRMNGQVYDSAHNEYLQYLVSIGPIGFLAYMLFLAAALFIIARKAKDKQWGIAIAAGISCYLVQALLTINLPIVTPIMWMLLSVGVANTEE